MQNPLPPSQSNLQAALDDDTDLLNDNTNPTTFVSSSSIAPSSQKPSEGPEWDPWEAHA
jgi:hypothetical protein